MMYEIFEYFTNLVPLTDLINPKSKLREIK